MSRDINELIYASETELWAVLEAASRVLSRRAAPHTLESETWAAGNKVILDRRKRLAVSCEALQVSTEPVMQVNSAWLAQLRAEFLEVHRQRDELQAKASWQPMDTAPLDRRILLKRPRSHGVPGVPFDVGIGRYDKQQFNKTPRPYWTDDRAFYSVAMNRQSTPIAWMEIPR